MKEKWETLSMTARAGLILGVLLICALVGVFGRWSLQSDRAVLFSDLNQQDAAAMVAELDRLKQPYDLADGGSAILVSPESVAKTRLKMVEKNLPAHGGVGFEIFNDTDYGMTEFAQKVNYLRALQGELTRTILALEEIQSARVHLVLPEGGLFKRAESRAKASVTLAIKAGRTLEKEQVVGIQRLVAASVPDMDHQDVTVLDASGAALSGGVKQQAADSGDWKLEAKRQVEGYLAGKVTALLDKAVGVGKGGVTVDAVLDLDNVKVTEEEVLPGAEGRHRRDAGVLVRERQSTRSAGAPAPAASGSEGTFTNIDAEYAVGRKIQQVVSTPGSIQRITVGVILPPDVGPAKLAQLRELISAAVGFDQDRGDVVAIHAAAGVAANSAAGVPEPATPAASAAVGLEPVLAVEPAMQVDAISAPFGAPQTFVKALPTLAMLLAAVALLAIGRYMWRGSGRRPSSPAAGDLEPVKLTDEQRQKLLVELRTWLSGAAPT